jgi:hypothetical protein
MDQETRIPRTAGGRKRKLPTTESRSLSKSKEGRQSSSKLLRPPVFDERASTMFLDAFTSVNAIIASAIAGLPYVDARRAMAMDAEDKRELSLAMHAVAEKYAPFFTKHKVALDFGIAWAGIHAAHIDNLFTRADSSVEQPPFKPSETLFLVALILTPLLIFAVISIVQHTRRD